MALVGCRKATTDSFFRACPDGQTYSMDEHFFFLFFPDFFALTQYVSFILGSKMEIVPHTTFLFPISGTIKQINGVPFIHMNIGLARISQ